MKNVRRGAVILISLLLLAIAGVVYFVLLGQWHSSAYAAGKTNLVKVYKIADESEEISDDSDGSGSGSGQHMVEAGAVIRGSKVSRYGKSVTADGVTYRQIKADLYTAEESDTAEEKETADEGSGKTGDEELYMEDACLVDSAGETVLEREVYVRTPATIYESPDAPDIASFAPKGTHLDIIGHDDLLANGYINMYKVRYAAAGGGEAEGYIYGKYTTDTQEAADAPYNEHGEYDAQSGDGFRMELYGGSATDVDLYPYERTVIEGNDFCRYARAMYLNAAAATHPDQYVQLIKDSGCNAVVIDLKDGPLTYQSEVARELSPTSYNSAYYTKEDLKKGVDAYREAGVYLIGRIVTFNDPYYAKDHPEDCIVYGGNAGWPSAYARNVWEYNVRLAQEAVSEFGFNEIQFDYVRFPESTYEMSKSGNADFRNAYGESKVQAVQNFCFYAADQLRESGAYISVDVFGESAYSYVTAYGQYWTSISNIVDAISAMPYTDHFSGNKPWEDPYNSVKRWANRAQKQQGRLQHPAVARTWITGYNTPHWAPNIDYDEKKMKAQINALEKCGLDGGFIPWNVLSDLGKYREYQGIWKE